MGYYIDKWATEGSGFSKYHMRTTIRLLKSLSNNSLSFQRWHMKIFCRSVSLSIRIRKPAAIHPVAPIGVFCFPPSQRTPLVAFYPWAQQIHAHLPTLMQRKKRCPIRFGWGFKHVRRFCKQTFQTFIGLHLHEIRKTLSREGCT